MMLGPTMHLRFVERQVIVVPEKSTPEYSVHKTVSILQQFWAHPDGKESCGDMFQTTLGSWRDVPKVTA